MHDNLAKTEEVLTAVGLTRDVIQERKRGRSAARTAPAQVDEVLRAIEHLEEIMAEDRRAFRVQELGRQRMKRLKVWESILIWGTIWVVPMKEERVGWNGHLGGSKTMSG